jgi:hypothetical protein
VAQLRAAQNRQRKQKTLLSHLKTNSITPTVSSPVSEELPSIEMSTTIIDIPIPPIPPGSDRQTRGFRVHIEPKTHTITRTNKKQKLLNLNEISTIIVKQEPIDISNIVSELSSSSSSSATVPIQGLTEKRKCSFCFSKFFFFV